jgi:hypothetical protein
MPNVKEVLKRVQEATISYLNYKLLKWNQCNPRRS